MTVTELAKEWGTTVKVCMEPLWARRILDCQIFCLYWYRCILYLVSSIFYTVSSSYLANMVLFISLSFFNSLLSHLILPLGFSLHSSSYVSQVRLILVNALLVFNEQQVMLKWVPPMTPLSSFTTTTLSAWGTQVDSAAGRVKLFQPLPEAWTLWMGIGNFPLLSYLPGAWWLPFLISM